VGDVVQPVGIDDRAKLQAFGVAVEQITQGLAHMTPLFGQPHANRAPVHMAFLVVHIAQFDQFFQIITDVAALIISTAFQFTGSHFVVTDIKQQKRLNRIDFQQSNPFKFILDHVQ